MISRAPEIPSQLTDAVENKRAVAFLGAGVSTACGVPLWKDMLAQCIERVRTAGTNSLVIAKKALVDGDYTLAAELLQATIGDDRLFNILGEIIRDRTRPDGDGGTDLLAAIARIPFSLFITTNFDTLFEDCYNGIPANSSHPLKACIWKDFPQILGALRDEKRTPLIHLHGRGDGTLRRWFLANWLTPDWKGSSQLMTISGTRLLIPRRVLQSRWPKLASRLRQLTSLPTLSKAS